MSKPFHGLNHKRNSSDAVIGMKSLEKPFNRREPLLPELTPYLLDDGYLYHKLVVSPPFDVERAGFINGSYSRKKKRLAELTANIGDGVEYVLTYERGYRFAALKRIADRLLDADYWRLVGLIWADSENIFQNIAGWKRVWSSPRHAKHECMSEQERAKLKSMPPSFRVWRGIGHRSLVQGISWTIDRDKAIWFARRFIFYDYCRLIHGEVKQRDVHAYFQERDESEIVASDVKVLKIDKLAPTQQTSFSRIANETS